jgi:serine phosphatase RsbU (regulator of sigma subunit)
VLRQVNRVLRADLPEDMFVTLIYGILDGAARTFTFARAGHDPLLHLNAVADVVAAYTPKGVAIGLAQTSQFDKLLEEKQVAFGAGDVLVFYTDGLTESLDAQANEFGRERVMAAIREQGGESAQGIGEAIVQAVDAFTGDLPPHDDRTLVVIKAL